MREQADRVEEALSRRIAETEESTRALEDELKAVSSFFLHKQILSKHFWNSFLILKLSLTLIIFSFRLLRKLVIINFLLKCESSFFTDCYSYWDFWSISKWNFAGYTSPIFLYVYGVILLSFKLRLKLSNISYHNKKSRIEISVYIQVYIQV